jgi:hypothetical protein
VDEAQRAGHHVNPRWQVAHYVSIRVDQRLLVGFELN